MSLTAQLAELLNSLSEAERPEGTRAAKTRLLHALGVGLASASLPAPISAWRVVAGEKGECLALGHREPVGEAAAAFHNAVAGHSALLEDCGPGGLLEGSHPGTYVIPAALATAEAYHASGRRLLAAVVAGYEAVSRLGAAAPPEIVARRFRPVAVMGPFGAAAAAATAQGFDNARLGTALALAANLGGGVSQGFLDGTMEPYFHAGFAARNGVLAARLANSGATVSEVELEGPYGFFVTFGGAIGNVDEVTRDTGDLGITRVGTKRFASCLQNQATIALVLENWPEPIDQEAVERIRLSRPAKGTNGLNSPGVDRPPPYHNMLQRQMAARFTLAAALLGRPVEDPFYFLGADEIASALAAKIDLVPSNDDAVSIEVEFRGGRRVASTGERPSVLFPSHEEIRARFEARARPLLGNVAETVVDLVEHLEQVENVRELTSLLRSAGKPLNPDLAAAY